MKKEIREAGKITVVVEAEPTCGLDLCDDCGECLVCNGNDACPCTSPYGGEHRWIVYQAEGEACS